MPHPPRALSSSSRRTWRGAAGTLLLLATASIESCATRAHPDESSADAEGAVAMVSSPSSAPVSADRPEAPPRASPATAAPSFEASVRPVLLSRCAPCHEPGGKMYARLPFDNAEVVAINAEGISRRLRGDDLAALKKWAAALPPQAGRRPVTGGGTRGPGDKGPPA